MRPPCGAPRLLIPDPLRERKRFRPTGFADCLAYLTEDLRIDEGQLLGLDLQALKEVGSRFGSRKVSRVVGCVEKMRRAEG